MRKKLGFLSALCFTLLLVGCKDTAENASLEVIRKGEQAVVTQSSIEASNDTIERQLEIIVKSKKKWLEGDFYGHTYMAVTDLDQNGVLEVIVSTGKQGTGRFTYSEYYQVNEKKEKLVKCKVDVEEGESQEDIVDDMNTVYYNPAAKEYCYITCDFASDGAAGNCYIYSRDALTLHDNKIRVKMLVYQEHETDYKTGKAKDTYWKLSTKGKMREIRADEYDVDRIIDKHFGDWEKMSVNISWVLIEDKSQVKDDVLYELARESYDKFGFSCALKNEERKICGYNINIPQIVSMEDTKTQERINKVIQKKIEEDFEVSVNAEGENVFRMNDFNWTVTHMNNENASILVEVDGMGEGAPHPSAWAYTIKLDLKKGVLLSNTDILSEKDYDKVEKLIMEQKCIDKKDIGYRKLCKKNYNGKLLNNKEDWKDVDVYYTFSYNGEPEGIGIVIPTIYAIGNYAIYEVYLEDIK